MMLERIQNKSPVPNVEYKSFPAVALSMSAHELELCAILSRTPYFISTL